MAFVDRVREHLQQVAQAPEGLLMADSAMAQTDDTAWEDIPRYLLGECKNWSSPVGRSELDAFRGKLQRRFGRCRLGFFVATGGFSEPFLHVLESYSASPDGIVVVPIGPEDLARLVQASDRNAELRRFHERAILPAGGSPSR